jgi:hypothetical protein
MRIMNELLREFCLKCFFTNADYVNGFKNQSHS